MQKLIRFCREFLNCYEVSHQVVEDRDEIMRAIKQLEDRILPDLSESRERNLAKIPFESKDVDLKLLFNLPLEKWVELEKFQNVKCMNLGGDRNRLILVNQSQEEWVDYTRHFHKGFAEEVVVIQGELVCEITKQIFRKGRGVYKIPAGQVHHPKLTPNSIIAIIFKKEDK